MLFRSIPDPAAAEGTEAERQVAFLDTVRMLRNRISLFLALPIEEIDKIALHHRLREIGRTDDAAIPAEQ